MSQDAALARPMACSLLEVVLDLSPSGYPLDSEDLVEALVFTQLSPAEVKTELIELVDRGLLDLTSMTVPPSRSELGADRALRERITITVTALGQETG